MTPKFAVILLWVLSKKMWKLNEQKSYYLSIYLPPTWKSLRSSVHKEMNEVIIKLFTLLIEKHIAFSFFSLRLRHHQRKKHCVFIHFSCHRLSIQSLCCNIIFKIISDHSCVTFLHSGYHRHTIFVIIMFVVDNILLWR